MMLWDVVRFVVGRFVRGFGAAKVRGIASSSEAPLCLAYPGGSSRR